jgi:hypothetical protein
MGHPRGPVMMNYVLRFTNSSEEAWLSKKRGMALSGTCFRSHGVCKELRIQSNPIQSTSTRLTQIYPGVDRV